MSHFKSINLYLQEKKKKYISIHRFSARGPKLFLQIKSAWNTCIILHTSRILQKIENTVRIKQYLELKLPKGKKKISPGRRRLTEHPAGRLSKTSTSGFLSKWFWNQAAGYGTFKQSNSEQTSYNSLNSMLFCYRQLLRPIVHWSSEPCFLPHNAVCLKRPNFSSFTVVQTSDWRNSAVFSALLSINLT